MPFNSDELSTIRNAHSIFNTAKSEFEESNRFEPRTRREMMKAYKSLRQLAGRKQQDFEEALEYFSQHTTDNEAKRVIKRVRDDGGLAAVTKSKVDKMITALERARDTKAKSGAEGLPERQYLRCGFFLGLGIVGALLAPTGPAAILAASSAWVGFYGSGCYDRGTYHVP